MNSCKDTALEPFFGNQLLNYQGTFSHNSLPSWYLQPFNREDGKLISLLLHSAFDSRLSQCISEIPWVNVSVQSGKVLL